MIIGITGHYCAGKDEMAEYLEQKQFFHISLSEILREKIRAQKKKPTRDNLIKYGNELRRKQGHGIIARLAMQQMEPNKNYTITSIRNPTEVEVLKTRKDFILVKVEAPIKERFERMKARIREKNREDDIQTFEEFKQKEQQEQSENPESQQVHKCMEMADVTIINNRDLMTFYKKIDRFLNDWRPKLDKRIGWDEYFLELTEVVAKRATCDRGKSGAVIVKDKRVLSTGYVGAPTGLPHCDEVGHQMREVINEDGTKSRHCIRTTHAEQNAIAQAARYGISINGATLYCKMEPCYTCAKIIINSGIKRVICKKRYHAAQLTREIFKKAGIKLEVKENKLEKYKDQ